uniref:Putative tail protein n=1 Tax=viral metagenome TaxID=1070528 RepID=A0A6M3IR49_9ZZZZ
MTNVIYEPTEEEILDISPDNIEVMTYNQLVNTGELADRTITNPTIRGGTLVVGSGDSVWKYDSRYGIWLGSADFASAPFSVSMAGAITGTSGAMGGWNIVTGYIYSLESGTPTASPNDGIVMASGNEGIICYEGTAKRAEFGYLSSGVYGLRVYDTGGSNVVLEASDTQQSIAGWYFTQTTLADNTTAASAKILIDSSNTLIRVGPTAGTYITVDGANQKVESSNYVSGAFGAGFHLSGDLLETGNIACRGIFRTAVFQKDVISAVGGSVAILDADVLDVDMTAADNSTLTIEGNTTFAVNDILRIKDGTDDEWMLVTNIGSAPTYTVTRDQAGDYASGANPVWKKGATVVNYGASGEGGVYMTASETNAPYLSIFDHAGAPWTTINTRLRIGNLNGYLGYSSDLYGIAIGETNDYLSYDSTNKLRIAASTENAITIDYGSDILLKEGGDIKFTSVTAPIACTATLIVTGTGNVDAGTHSYKITYVNATGETGLGTESNQITTDISNKQVALSAIPVSSSGSVTSRKIYRTKAGGTDYYLLTTIANNTATTYTDNTADASLTGGVANNLRNDSFGKLLIDNVVSVRLEALNTFIGQTSGQTNTTGYRNTGVGSATLQNNTTGYDNVSIGESSMVTNSTGYSNTAVGRFTLNNNNTNFNNTAIGAYAMQSNAGDNNTAVGVNALNDNNIGDDNVAIGYLAAEKNTNGTRNVAVGSNALKTQTEVNDNTAIGYNALAVTTGGTNVAIGSNALDANTSGYSSVAVGYTALTTNTTGALNIGIGDQALKLNLSGDSNVAIGGSSLVTNSTGSGNIGIGFLAGAYETGSGAFYVNNQDRTNTAGDKSLSLIYGVMAATAAAQKLTINALLNLSVSKTPASAAAAGTAGDIAWDASYIYVCTATDTWERAGIATW